MLQMPQAFSSKIDLVSIVYVTEIVLRNHSNQIKWNLQRHDNLSMALNRMLKLYYWTLGWAEDSNMKLPCWWWVPCPTAHSDQNSQRQWGNFGMVAREPTILGGKGIRIWRGGVQWVKKKQKTLWKLILCAGWENYNKILRVKSMFYMAS